MVKTDYSYSERDFALLMQAIESFSDENFDNIETVKFDDARIGMAFNHMLESVMNRNNRFLSRINDAMNRIADISCIKIMFEQIESHLNEVRALRDKSKSFGYTADTLTEKSDEMLAVSLQVKNTIRPAITELADVYDEIKRAMTTIGELTEDLANTRSEIRMLCMSGVSEAINIRDQISSLNFASVTLNDSIKEAEAGLRHSLDRIKGIDSRISTISKNTESIYKNIDSQITNTDEFLNAVNSIADGYSSLSVGCFDTGQHLYRISRDIDNARNDLYRQNSRPTIHDRLNVFDTDHLTLTWRLYNNIVEFESLKITQINNPNSCKFGVWYHSITDPLIKDSPELSSAWDAHLNLHKHAVNCFEAKAAYNLTLAYREFSKTLDAYNTFHSALNALHAYLHANNINEETEIWKFEE